jgi:hypothetical protein
MKPFLLSLIALVFFSSCQKELTEEILRTTPVTGGTSGSGSMTAKIDGVAWVADKGAAATISPALGTVPGLINISGLSNGKKHLTITLTDSGSHNYLLPPDNLWMNAAAYVDSTQTNSFSYSTNQSYIANEPNGSVKITSIDAVKKTMSGTFSFTVYRQMDTTKHTITEGVFTNIPYTNGFGLPASNTTDTFRVKVDGVAMAPFSINGNLMTLTNQLMVQASTQSLSENVGLMIPATITAGTYPLDFFSATHIGTYQKSGTSFASTSGSIQVLEHNTSTKRIRANFSFVAQPMLSTTPTYQITEGYFSVKYQ